MGDPINGKILKSEIDFPDYLNLKKQIEDFGPDLIGIRTLTFYKDFFHKTVALIRQWGINTPIITGGPYATSDYQTILSDKNVDLCVLGEGEETLKELVLKMLENGGKIPAEYLLSEIKGLAFLPRNSRVNQPIDLQTREIILLDQINSQLTMYESVNLELRNEPGDLLYVIYTSGSTGTRKE